MVAVAVVIKGYGNFGGSFGPSLSRDLLVARVQSRLSSPQYREQLQSLNEINEEPFSSTREMRNRILALSGEEAVREWIVNKILEPRWDNLNSPMPNLGLTRDQAIILANYLLEVERPNPITWWTERIFSRRFLAGTGVGVVVGVLIAMLIKNMKRSKEP